MDCEIPNGGEVNLTSRRKFVAFASLEYIREVLQRNCNEIEIEMR